MMLWADFHPYVLTEVPGAPIPLVDHALRQAAIDLCRETGLHVVESAPINVVANQRVYAVTPPSNELAVSLVKFAWFKDRPLYYVSQEALNSSGGRWPADSRTEPSYFTQYTQDELVLYPIPTEDAPSALRLLLVLHPSLSSTGVEDWIGARFVTEIAHGALAILCGMAGTPWANPESEAKHRALFEAAKTRTTIDALKSFTRSTLRLAIPVYG